MILRAAEGSLCPVSCLEDEVNQCPRSQHCETLFVWKQLDKAISDVVDSITLAQILEHSDAPDNYVI